jgi:hypothetical protein
VLKRIRFSDAKTSFYRDSSGLEKKWEANIPLMFQSAAARPVPDSSPVPEGPAPTNLFPEKKESVFLALFPLVKRPRQVFLA